MERRKFMDLLFARAKQEGFAACEVYASDAESFSVTVFSGEIDEYNVCSEGGLSFRGLYNDRMGYASTQVLDEDAVEMLVSAAKENALLIENPDKRFNSDLPYYVKRGLMAEDQSIFRMPFVVFRFICNHFDPVKGTAAFLAILIALIIFANYFYLKHWGGIDTKARGFRILTQLMSIGALFAGPIYVKGIHEHFYKNTYASFAWHSPTQQMMTFFTVLALICFFKMVENRDLIPCCTGMIQKEVAERLAAAPGGKTYGVLSVLMQAWYDVEYLFTVDEHVFNPPPKVKSAVIRMTRNGKTSLGCDEQLFRRIVKTVFTMRRKMMRNGMKQILGKDSPLLADSMFTRRPEQLSVQEYVDLTNRVEAELKLAL